MQQFYGPHWVSQLILRLMLYFWLIFLLSLPVFIAMEWALSRYAPPRETWPAEARWLMVLFYMVLGSFLIRVVGLFERLWRTRRTR